MFIYCSVYLSPLVCKKVCYKLCEQHFARSLVIQALKSVAQNLIRQFSRTSSDKVIDRRRIVRIILRSSLYKDDESTKAPWYQQQCKGHLTSYDLSDEARENGTYYCTVLHQTSPIQKWHSWFIWENSRQLFLFQMIYSWRKFAGTFQRYLRKMKVNRHLSAPLIEYWP